MKLIYIIDELIGWAVLALIIWGGTEIRFKGGIYKFSFFDFGPAGINRKMHPELYKNLKTVGYTLFPVGNIAIGWSVPQWLTRLIKQIH